MTLKVLKLQYPKYPKRYYWLIRLLCPGSGAKPKTEITEFGVLTFSQVFFSRSHHHKLAEEFFLSRTFE